MSERNKKMNQPTTPDELRFMHELLRTDPERYLRVATDWIDSNPTDSHAYFSRHFAWMRIAEPERALDDLNKVIELDRDPDPISYLSRGEIYRHLGKYEKAIEDFNRGEAINPRQWEGDAMGLLYQADCHARLGDEEAALACCRRLPDDFWTPGVDGVPRGNKEDIADELKRIAAVVRAGRDDV